MLQLQAELCAVSLKHVFGDLSRFNGRLYTPVGSAGKSEGVEIGVASYVTVTVGMLSWYLHDTWSALAMPDPNAFEILTMKGG